MVMMIVVLKLGGKGEEKKTGEKGKKGKDMQMQLSGNDSCAAKIGAQLESAWYRDKSFCKCISALPHPKAGDKRITCKRQTDQTMVGTEKKSRRI